MAIGASALSGGHGFNGPSTPSVQSESASSSKGTVDKQAQRSTNAAIRRILGGSEKYQAGRRGPGWTQAQVQRMAKKRRNVKANRRNHKG
jgi:beta-galactosidase GanA